jgi:Flp pilus assembly pilin Flp
MSEKGIVRRFVLRLRRFGSSEDAIAITEYGLLIALVALALLAVLAVFAPGMSSWFSSKTGTITTV